eukprot:PLAT9720.1.p1 GENE.PLAT9720.1~~PLAT9720.1.p1  ORF type:complete len:342 (-),score=155.16 PLAT9720.1:66-1091(-)
MCRPFRYSAWTIPNCSEERKMLQRCPPAGVAQFVAKVYRMLSTDKCSDFIRWTDDGSGFRVYQPADFSRCVLPRFFKHAQFPSFTRQLNMYNWKSISTGDPAVREFHHPFFHRDRPEDMVHIKRKPSSSKQAQMEMLRKRKREEVENSEALAAMSSRCAVLERQMELMQQGMADMQAEAYALWTLLMEASIVDGDSARRAIKRARMGQRAGGTLAACGEAPASPPAAASDDAPAAAAKRPLDKMPSFPPALPAGARLSASPAVAAAAAAASAAAALAAPGGAPAVSAGKPCGDGRKDPSLSALCKAAMLSSPMLSARGSSAFMPPAAPGSGAAASSSGAAL